MAGVDMSKFEVIRAEMAAAYFLGSPAERLGAAGRLSPRKSLSAGNWPKSCICCRHPIKPIVPKGVSE